ncbi:MAG: DUF3095 family protein [Burkholderiales bacterium]
MNTARFYSGLPVHTAALSELMEDETQFSAVPEDWHVILTDVCKSTQALSDGKHQQVNLVAAGSIIAALNIAHREDVELPFFFGGDGATLLAPPAIADAIEAALRVHRENTRVNFGLDLRVGRVAVADIYRNNVRLTIAKVDVNHQGLVIPVALGEGLLHAERIIKDGDAVAAAPAESETVDLEGMECRWDSIPPPANTQEVVCLLITVRRPERQAAIIAGVLKEIETTYGPLAQRSPVSRLALKLDKTVGKITTEMRARLGRFDFTYLAENWLRTVAGGLYFAFNREGSHYLDRLVQLSDTLMIDGRVTTVMSGTAGQRQLLVAALTGLEQKGDLVFALQVCSASVMSCYVRDRRDRHVHFVDGLGGGYTQASSVLKKKLAQQVVGAA